MAKVDSDAVVGEGAEEDRGGREAGHQGGDKGDYYGCGGHRRNRVIGPLLREDYAPAIRDGVPYSKRESVSDPADLAAMNALCGYLTVVQGRHPGALPGPCRWASRTPPSGRVRPNSSMRPGR